MRVLIHGLNFAPELVGVGKYTGEMAEWLAARGHQVRVVTAPPFNPAWSVAAPFSTWRYARESYIGSVPTKPVGRELAATVAGGWQRAERGSARLGSPEDVSRQAAVLLAEPIPLARSTCEKLEIATGRLTVHRCPLWVPRRPSALRRILHLASFGLASFPVMLWQIFWKPEVVIAIEPTMFCAPAALLSGRLSGARTWLHVQDFEVDAGFDLGLLKSPTLRRTVEMVEKQFIFTFNRVSTISGKMLAKLEHRGVSPSACRLFPNWVDTDEIFPLRRPSPLRAKLGISEKEIVALYSGTMACKQGLEVLAEAAHRLVGNATLRFVFCGDGPGKAMLAGLTGGFANVLWIPLQPLDRLNYLLNLADIHLLPQKADAADLVMPSKLTGMLASGRPVVATAGADTQLAQAVYGRGIVVEPGNASTFAHAIEQLASSPVLRERLGKNAREYALSDLEKEIVLSRFEKELLLLAAS